jgi:hypothetical protein
MGDCCEVYCEECDGVTSSTWRAKGKSVCYECYKRLRRRKVLKR